ncbi:hypothetical protein SDC9_132599 [bioreactor metagenome]|uniref:Uncharacterized protein n=1 Tax=bioreactor metagenome TaxID=1076179 RepID=A0A645D8Z3_9ZZZZ
MGAFLLPENQRGGVFVLFTEGKSQAYERLMQEKPCFDRHPVKTMKERDCPHCLHYDNEAKKCGLGKCPVFQD